MQLTYAKTQADLEQIADFMSKVFAQRSYFDFYKNRMDYQTLDPWYKPEYSRIVKEGDKIVSHVSIVEKSLRIGSSTVKLAGIGDVFTLPEARGKSYSRLLMEDAVQYMKDHDFALSMLYGIAGYYHKFGYIEAMGKYETFLPVKHTQGMEIQHTLRAAEPGDTARLNELYNQAYGNLTGSMKRVEAHWYKINHPKRVTVATDDQETIIGYAIVSPSGPNPTYLQEAAVFDISVARSLLAHFAAQAREKLQPELEFHIHPDNTLMQYVFTLGGQFNQRVFGEGEGQPMLRTINIGLCLSGIQEELQARLSQSSLIQNDYAFNIVTDDAGSAAIKISGGKIEILNKPDSEYPTLNIPQNLLVRTLIGHWSVDQITMRDPSIEIDPEMERWLKVLFPVQHPVTSELDFF